LRAPQEQLPCAQPARTLGEILERGRRLVDRQRRELGGERDGRGGARARLHLDVERRRDASEPSVPAPAVLRPRRTEAPKSVEERRPRFAHGGHRLQRTPLIGAALPRSDLPARQSTLKSVLAQRACTIRAPWWDPRRIARTNRSARAKRVRADRSGVTASSCAPRRRCSRSPFRWGARSRWGAPRPATCASPTP